MLRPARGKLLYSAARSSTVRVTEFKDPLKVIVFGLVLYLKGIVGLSKFETESNVLYHYFHISQLVNTDTKHDSVYKIPQTPRLIMRFKYSSLYLHTGSSHLTFTYDQSFYSLLFVSHHRTPVVE